jgi:hypothetical protein
VRRVAGGAGLGHDVEVGGHDPGAAEAQGHPHVGPGPERSLDPQHHQVRAAPGLEFQLAARGDGQGGDLVHAHDAAGMIHHMQLDPLGAGAGRPDQGVGGPPVVDHQIAGGVGIDAQAGPHLQVP